MWYFDQFQMDAACSGERVIYAGLVSASESGFADMHITRLLVFFTKKLFYNKTDDTQITI